MKKMLLFFILIGVWWLPLSSNDTVYLFAHGLFSDQTLAYYYEYVRKPFEVIHRNNEIQIIYKSGYRHSWKIENPDDERVWIIQQPLHSFDFPDAQRGLDRSQTSLGQDNEIRTLANAYEKIKNNNVIIMGMSRGASTVLNFLATRKPPSVIAAIVESPFDSIIDTLNTHCGDFWLSFVPAVLYSCPNVLFGKFDRNGIFPINVIDQIDKNIPIIIIASFADTLIPTINSTSLYLKLLENNYPHVYLLLLDKGEHAYLLEDDDAPLYLNTVHAFYQKYNLPHNCAFAAQGQTILAQCQPSKAIVEHALKIKRSFIRR